MKDNEVKLYILKRNKMYEISFLFSHLIKTEIIVFVLYFIL